MQVDLKDAVNEMMYQTGNSWYNKLEAQLLFPTVGPILVDLKEAELRDAFVTGSVAQYTEGVDGQLEKSLGLTAGNS